MDLPITEIPATQQMMTPQPELNSEKKNSPVLIIGLIIVILATFGYTGLRIYNSQNSIPAPTPKPILTKIVPTLTPTQFPEVQIPTDWVTYKNSVYAFEIKTPPDYSRKVIIEKTNDGLTKPYFEETFYRNRQQLEISVMKYLGDEFNKDKLGLQINVGSQKLENYKQTEYAGQLSYKYEIVSGTDIIESDVAIITPDKTAYVFFRYSGFEYEVFDQILSTFKFTNGQQEDNATNWKSYTTKGLEEYKFPGYVLYYPNDWQLKIEMNTDNPVKSITLTVSKTDGSSIKLYQGFSDGGNCLFPNDTDRDGNFTRYGNYYEIKKDNNIWRAAKIINTPNSYTTEYNYLVCSKFANNDFFAGITNIGDITANINNDTDLQTFYKILEKIQIIQ